MSSTKTSIDLAHLSAGVGASLQIQGLQHGAGP